MKIKNITFGMIEFDNGSTIEFNHEQDCCENNYADFKAIDDLAKDAEFKEPLTLESVDGSGFRFGNPPDNMHFVPCYSDQNGYYSSDIDILYTQHTGTDCVEHKISFNAEVRIDVYYDRGL